MVTVKSVPLPNCSKLSKNNVCARAPPVERLNSNIQATQTRIRAKMGLAAILRKLSGTFVLIERRFGLTLAIAYCCPVVAICSMALEPARAAAVFL